MIIEPPLDTKQTPTSNTPENGALHFDPGASHRKPRSVTKACLWLTLLICLFFGSIGVYSVVSKFWYGMRHPHRAMYHNKDSEVTDWSQVVQPMITKDSNFDIIASVWIRDDTAGGGTITIDGEDRTERLLYSGIVFHNVHLGSKDELANVTLSIPTNYLAQPNISNYDLRASFVLAQPEKTSWWNFAKNYTSWRPQESKAPTIRKWEEEPSLEDKIYDSFGFTIPLIQFHNVTNEGAFPPAANVMIDDITLEEDTENDMDSDDELDLNEESVETPPKDQHKQKNSFNLEFTGGQNPAAGHHPCIVTRTHIRVTDETELFKRHAYDKAQRELANHLCVFPSSNSPYERPLWYQCSRRSYFTNGVFETKVQLRKPLEGTEQKNRKKWRIEWLYAPFMSATERVAGPKDIIPIPIDGRGTISKAVPHSLLPAEERVTVVWKLSFSGRTPDKLLWLDGGGFTVPQVYNMTIPDNEMEHLQHKHDLTMGLLGHRIHEDEHPRRVHALGFASGILSIISWSLTLHYWYTRTSTAGISRLGTVFIACNFLISAHEGLLSSIFRPGATGHWVTRIPISYALRLIPALVMLKAAARLEFGWSTDAGDSKKKGWVPKVYFAKATHVERASDRVESKVPARIKAVLLIAGFAFFHFSTPSSTYLLTPRVPQPTGEPHPLHSLSPHSPTILGCTESFGSSLYVTGSILQIIMNRQSKTFAGDYKTATFLLLLSELLALLDLVPRVVGRSTRLGGVSVADGVTFLTLVVSAAQATRYRNVRNSDVEDVE